MAAQPISENQMAEQSVMRQTTETEPEPRRFEGQTEERREGHDKGEAKIIKLARQ